LTIKSDDVNILPVVITVGNILWSDYMKKKISKEQIVNVTLELIRNKNDLRELNLREIARTIGCAHTNIYNYFPSYTDLLWETHATLGDIFVRTINRKLSETLDSRQKLKCFFETCIEFYLSNKGWFRLAWLEYIGGNRPESHVEITSKVVDELIHHLIAIWNDVYNVKHSEGNIFRVLHNTHCYIIGEVSNFISGRATIKDEDELKDYMLEQAVGIFVKCLKEG
jgi:AcrR family transcriptional regulator